MVDVMAKNCNFFTGLDTAAKSGQHDDLQPVPRLRHVCAGITFEGRVDFVMKMITLTQGQRAMVDDEDYEFLNQWKWYARRGKRKQTTDTWYAQRTGPRPNKQAIHMHREVLGRMGIQDFPQGDHKDSNGLNNQRYNLRPATVNQNGCNRRKRNGCTSRFKGVHWHKANGSGWMTTIYLEGKLNYLGTFENETVAAKVYDAAARHHFGEFAKLNFNQKP